MNEISCPYCHGITDGSLEYCQECGHQIYHCPTCHTPIIVYRKYCEVDHTRIPGSWLKGLPKPEGLSENKSNSGKESAKGKKFSLKNVLIVFLLAGLVLFLIINGTDNKDNSQEYDSEKAAASGAESETVEEEATDSDKNEDINSADNNVEADSFFDYRDPYSYAEYEKTQNLPDEDVSEAANVHTENQTVTEEPVSDGQVFPDSSTRKITDEEINRLSLSEIQDAINEIYARNGYIFNGQEYRSYYERFDWYHGTISSERFNEINEFNDIEYYNVEKMRVRRDMLK